MLGDISTGTSLVPRAPLPYFLFFPDHHPCIYVLNDEKLPDRNITKQIIFRRYNYASDAPSLQRAPTTSFVERRANLSSRHANNLGCGASVQRLRRTPPLVVPYLSRVPRVRSYKWCA